MPGRLIACLCVSMLAGPAAADVYTWTDSQGVTHFSDTAHGHRPSEPVTLGTTSVVPMAGNVNQSKRVSDIRRQVQKALEREKPTRRNRDRDKQSLVDQHCDRLQARISKVQQRLRAGYSNDQGNSLRRQRRALSQRYSQDCVLG